jgi:hypothetical protein
VDLNAPDEPGPLDQLLIEYQEELCALYKRSPYYIERPADTSKDFDDKITRYTDKCVAGGPGPNWGHACSSSSRSRSGSRRMAGAVGATPQHVSRYQVLHRVWCR